MNITSIKRCRIAFNMSLLFISAANIAVSFFAVFLFTKHIDDVCFTAQRLALFNGFAFLASVIIPFMTKGLQKKFGAKGNLLRGIVLPAIGLIGLALSRDIFFIIIFRILIALGAGYNLSAFELSDISEKDFENDDTRRKMKEFIYFGAVVGIICGIVFCMYANLRSCLMVFGLLMCVCVVLNFIFIKDNLSEADEMCNFPEVDIKKAYDEDHIAFIKNQVLSFLIGFVLFVPVVLIPPLVVAVSDPLVAPWNVGVIFAFITMFFAGKPIFKKISKRYNTKRVFFFTVLLLSVTLSAFLFVGRNMFFLILASSAMAFFMSGLMSIKKELALESLYPSARDAERYFSKSMCAFGSAVGCLAINIIMSVGGSLIIGFIAASVAAFISGIFALAAYNSPDNNSAE